MKPAVRLLQCLAIVALLPLMAQAQFEDEHAFLWTQAGGIQDLGTITGSQNSIAYGISQLGEVVGYDIVGNTAIPFRWTSKAGMQGLVGFGTLYGSAAAVNSSGAIIGNYYPNGDSLPARAFIWTSTGGLEDLGTLGGTTATVGGINRSGQVIGSSTTASGVYDGFLWTQDGGMQDLGTFRACGINDAGLIAGSTSAANGDSEAAVWDKGKISILGPGYACGINNRGQVVGSRYTRYTNEQAFIWSPGGGGMQLLPMLPGAVATIGQAINNSGEVVGWDWPPTGSSAYRAFIWTQAGGTQDIGNLGGIYGAQAFAINDAGEVTGSSTIQ